MLTFTDICDGSSDFGAGGQMVNHVLPAVVAWNKTKEYL